MSQSDGRRTDDVCLNEGPAGRRYQVGHQEAEIPCHGATGGTGYYNPGGEGLYPTGTNALRMDGSGFVAEFTTNLQTGFLEIQDGYVRNIHAVPCLANWDFYRTNTLPMQPPVKAVQKDGIKRLIIYDDPEELPFEAKLFE